MKKTYVNSSFLLIIVILILLVSACAGPKVQGGQLPDGMSSSLVPNLPLDGYIYARQSQPTVIPRVFLGLPFDAAIQSVEVWLVPSDATESIGAVLTLSTQRDAEALFMLVPQRADLWKMLSDRKIYLVWGGGSGAEGLKRVINARQFAPLKEADKEAWNLIERLPGPPAVKPSVAGFVRMEGRLINFVQKNTPGGSDESVASAVKIARIKMAAASFYSTRVLQITDLLSPASLKDAGAGGIVIARSSLPGFVISAALGPAASMLNIKETNIDGRTAYYTTVDGPSGGKAHVFFNNSGQYIYAEGALDLTRSQQLYRWVWGLN